MTRIGSQRHRKRNVNMNLTFMGPCIVSIVQYIYIYIYIYIQQDATLHSLYLETALQVSGGISTHHQERIQLYLQHLLFVTPLLLPAASGR